MDDGGAEDPVGEAVKAIVIDELEEIGADTSQTDKTTMTDLHFDGAHLTFLLNAVQNRLLKNQPSYVFTWPPPKISDALGYTIDDLIGAVADNTVAAKP